MPLPLFYCPALWTIAREPERPNISAEHVIAPKSNWCSVSKDEGRMDSEDTRRVWAVMSEPPDFILNRLTLVFHCPLLKTFQCALGNVWLQNIVRKNPLTESLAACSPCAGLRSTLQVQVAGVRMAGPGLEVTMGFLRVLNLPCGDLRRTAPIHK